MSETKSLLEMAMAHEHKRRTSKAISEGERELALAWVRGTITISQVAAAMGCKSGGVYPFLASALREELLKGY